MHESTSRQIRWCARKISL